MELQQCQSQSQTRSFPQLKSKKKFLMIETCQDCHQHHSLNSHDETLFYQLYQSISVQLQHNSMEHIRIVRNRSFKYLSKMTAKNLPFSKKNAANEKYDYFNQHTKKVQRFPRLGAFEVYFNNFIVFSLLKSSFRVCVDDTSQQTNEQNDAKIIRNQNFQEEQNESFSSITVKTLSKLIVQVIKILSQNSSQVSFLQKVEDIFRFLQLEWKPIPFHQSIVQFLLSKTSKQNLSSVEQIIKPLLKLIQNPDTKVTSTCGLRQSPKYIVPYTYYKKSEKTCRIKSIYQEKSSKKVILSESRAGRFENLKSISRKAKIFNKDNQKDLKTKDINNKIKIIPLKKVNKEVHKSLLVLKQKPQILQKKQNILLQTTQQKNQKQQGFIIKRSYKKTNISNFQNSNQINSLTQESNFQGKKYGFISKSQLLKQTLLQNQILLESHKATTNDYENKQNFKRQNSNIGKILCKNESIQKVTSLIEIQENMENFSQKVFRRTKNLQSRKDINSLVSSSRNLVRNSLSQRRPLSSTLASKKERKNGSSSLKKTISFSEKSFTVTQIKENQAPNNQNESIHEAKQNNADTQNVAANQTFQSSLSVKSKSPSPSVLAREKKVSEKKYQKDFVKENIRRVSFTKRVNSFGMSTSFWQSLRPKFKVDKNGKKSFSYSKRQGPLVHARNFSAQRNELQKVEKNSIKKNADKSNKSYKSNSQSIVMKNLSIKSKSNSIKSSFEKDKSLKNQSSKHSRQISSAKLEENEKHSIKQDLTNEEKEVEKTENIPQKNHQEIIDSIISQNQPIYQTILDPQPNNSQHEQNPSFHYQHQPAQNLHTQQQQSSSIYNNLIIYTLGSQQDDQTFQIQKQKSHFNTQTTAYYNHSLFVRLEHEIKYQPAYIIYQLHYDGALECSERFGSLLKEKNFVELQKIAKFSFQKQQIYQQYVTKSLRQMYKLNQLKLFPLLTTKPQQFFNPQSLTTSLNCQQQSSSLPDIVYLLTRINKKLILRLFQNVKSINYLGYYGVWLYDLSRNKFQLVVVDDQFCVAVEKQQQQSVSQQKFIFTGILSQNSIWYMVLQKAVAKFLGGYYKIDQLTFSKLFKILTGSPYADFIDLGPEKLIKVFNQKFFFNKKTTVYATMSKSKCLENKNSQDYNSCVEKITGWSFNEKNPFLSLVHFQSATNRIQSLTMMDFSKEFQGITLSFFNLNFSFNHVKLKMTDSIQRKKIAPKVIEILSNSHTKDNICYISVSQGQCKSDENETFIESTKRSLKTTLKIYKQVISFDRQKRPKKQGNNKQLNDQKCSAEIENQTFRYNGQITKGGQFFIEVALKSGRNLCFVQTEAESLEIGFYSQQQVNARILSGKQVTKVKLISGERYLKVDENTIKKINNHQKSSSFEQQQVNNSLLKTKRKTHLLLEQKDMNTQKDQEKKMKKRRKQKQQLDNSEIKIKQNVKKYISQLIKKGNRQFLEDRMIQCEELNTKEFCKKKI